MAFEKGFSPAPEVMDAGASPEKSMDKPSEGENWANAVELPADTGGWQDSIKLPDDTGEWQDSIELPDDSENRNSIISKSGKEADLKERELPEKMEPPVAITFKYPEGASEQQKEEFKSQLKAQENGLNAQSVAENMENRAKYQERKGDTGNGRDPESFNAQQEVRERFRMQRIAENQENGMSYSDAKAEADTWLKTQAALHDPDQIAGGDPMRVSRMGDRGINSSIGKQWGGRVDSLSNAVAEFAQNYSKDELANIKMNVKLEVE